MSSLTHRTGQSGDSESLVHEEVFCPELISDNLCVAGNDVVPFIPEFILKHLT